MKTKTKIMAFVSLASLTMVLLMVGVWALKTVNFTVGGNLSYIAPGIEATISKGTMSNGVWVNASDASTKMPLTQITRTDTEESLEEKFSYWQDLNLNFNEAGDDVTITFSITNDMAKYGLAINVTTSCDDADNATISINTSSVTLAPNASQEFVITLAVTEKTANASLLGFSVVFNMEMTDIPPTPAEDVSYLTFEYDDTTMEAKLVGYDGVTEDVVIPARILNNQKTYDVTSIAENEDDGFETQGIFYYNENIKSVSWPFSITTVEDEIFEGCISLESVVIAKGVTSIGEFAFCGCTSLTSITIPNSVTSIGDFAFGDCESLTYNTYDKGEYLGNDNNPYVVLMKAVSTDITSFTINNNCKVIYDSSFANCSDLASITIPNGVTCIGYYAFQGCSTITSIIIPDSVIILGDCFLDDCTALTSIEIGNGVTRIDTHTFRGAGNKVFSIKLGNGLTYIGSFAFSDWESLTSITIPNSVTSIDYSAFKHCTGLTSVTIGNGVTSIGNEAFRGCTGLTSITIPDSVTSIGLSAFNGCTSLVKVEVKATTPPTGGGGMFRDCPLTTGIFVPSASVDLYKSAEYWSDYSSKIQAGNF